MSPIVTESDGVVNCIPPHFGPPCPEFSSFWWKVKQT